VSEPISPEMWAAALNVLHAVAKDPGCAPDLAALERAVQPIAKQARRRRRSGPVTDAESERRQEQSRADRESGTTHDQSVLSATALHQIHRGAEMEPEGQGGVLIRSARTCYICGEDYREIDAFYHSLCPACAVENRFRREQRADLLGRTALVTGGRIKIGHAAALRLLRNGARVIVTTRFPREAANRFLQASDFEQWRDRLHIYGLNFVHLPSVLAFAERLAADFPALDILINNAAQTVKRPAAFYAPALAFETGAAQLPDDAQALLASISHSEPRENSLIPYFGPLDRHGQPEDFRDVNSWSLLSHEVPPPELLEVLVINAAAPCLLTSRLKPMLLRSPNQDRYIVNAAGLDGRFETNAKSPRHPHVNMSKAALNMFTRTAASDFARDGIHMNSVDTGWISDEAGHAVREERKKSGWVPPLDEVDAAARLCAPIFDGMAGVPQNGILFRHYRPSAW